MSSKNFQVDIFRDIVARFNETLWRVWIAGGNPSHARRAAVVEIIGHLRAATTTQFAWDETYEAIAYLGISREERDAAEQRISRSQDCHAAWHARNVPEGRRFASRSRLIHIRRERRRMPYATN